MGESFSGSIPLRRSDLRERDHPRLAEVVSHPSSPTLHGRGRYDSSGSNYLLERILDGLLFGLVTKNQCHAA